MFHAANGGSWKDTRRPPMSSQSSPARQPIQAPSALLAIFVSILWGGNVVSIRLGVDSIPPLWSAFWRMLLGVIVVGAWAFFRRIPLGVPRSEMGPLLSLGLLFTIQIGLLNTGAALTSPAYGVLILNSYAVFANLIGHFFSGHSAGAALEERLTPTRILGLLLSFAGIAVLTFGQPVSKLAPNPILGNLILTVSCALLGLRQVYTRWVVQSIDPVRAIVWQMACSVPLFLIVAALSEPLLLKPISTEAILAITYQGAVVAGVCFIIWAQLLQRHSAGALSMYAFLVPVSGVVLSSILFGEALRPQLLVGAALIFAGVYVVSVPAYGKAKAT
jgi:drug/metabolite transporter (DMT)-like permease